MDNFHNGGCAYPIDVDAGIVNGPGMALGSNQKIYKHPSTGKEMVGLYLPNWDIVLETVRAAALIMPNVGYIGWDIAITETGCEIIEANVNYPGTNIMQLDGFNVYEKVKMFLKDSGVSI